MKLKTLDKPVYSDVSGRKMIIEGAVEYIKGEKSLEQAASEITQRVNLYLSE